MPSHDWIEDFPAAITVTDAEGIIMAMNRAAIKSFETDGGADLIGRSVLDCHPEPARSKLADLLAARKMNVYTIEKNGTKKMIYQSPWYVEGRFGGIVELTFEIPASMPHFLRG